MSATIIALFVGDTAAPLAADQVYGDAAIFTLGGSNLGLTFTTAGATGFAYDGAYKSNSVACPTGAYHLVMMRTNGTTLGMTIDSAAEIRIACGPFINGGGAGVASRVGSAYTPGTPFFDGRILELMVSNAALTDADYANLKRYVNARYALAL
jgi:hypothetical protein